MAEALKESLFEKIERKELTKSWFDDQLQRALNAEHANKRKLLCWQDKNHGTILHIIINLTSDSIEVLHNILAYLEDNDVAELARKKNGEGYAALHLAVVKENKDVINALLEKISDSSIKLDLINQPLTDDVHNTSTLLHLAVKSELQDIVDCIIDNLKVKHDTVHDGNDEETDASDVESSSPKYLMPDFTPDSEGYNVLHSSAQNKGVCFNSILELISTKDAIVEKLRQAANGGLTVLHIAFEKGVESVFTSIKEATRVDQLVMLLKAKDNKMRTPVNLAVEQGQDTMIKLLERLHDEDDSSQSMVHSQITTLCDLLSEGMETAFHSAAKSGACFQELLDLLSADSVKRQEVVLKTNGKKQNVFHLASREWKLNVFQMAEKVITKQNGDFDYALYTTMLMAADNDGYTPLQYAAKNPQYDIISHVLGKLETRNISVLQLLLQVNKAKETVVDIVANRQTSSESSRLNLLSSITKCLQNIQLQFSQISEVYSTVEKDFIKCEQEYDDCKAKLTQSKTRLDKSRKACQDSLTEKTREKRDKCQKSLDECDKRAIACKQRLDKLSKDLSTKRPELREKKSEKNAIAKNLELMNFAIHKSANNQFPRIEMDGVITALLLLMSEKIEKVGLLVLLTESASNSYVANNRKSIGEILELKDKHEKEIHDPYELLEMATKDLTMQNADQYVLKWTDSKGNTLVHIAAQKGDETVVRRLVEWQVTSHPLNKDSVLHSINDEEKTPENMASAKISSKFWKDLGNNLNKYPEPLQDGAYLQMQIFYQSENRKNAEKEVDDLRHFGQVLGIQNPEVYKNATAQELKTAISKGEPASCLIVAVLAHGRSGQVSMSDRSMEIRNIVKVMESKQQNNPMVLLLEACLQEYPMRPYDERHKDDNSIDLHHDLADFVREKLEKSSKEQELKGILKDYGAPKNIPLETLPPVTIVRSDNLVLRSTFAVATMVHLLDQQTETETDQIKEIGKQAIKLTSQAYHFLKHCPLRTRVTDAGYPEEYDDSITSGYAFDYVPSHFLCLSATVNAATAKRGLMTGLLCKKLDEVISSHQHGDETVKEAGNPETNQKRDECEVDIQRLFEYVLAAVHVETHQGQVSIIARTLLKRLCLHASKVCPQKSPMVRNPEDGDDDVGDAGKGDGDANNE